VNNIIFGAAISSKFGKENELLSYLKTSLEFSNKAVELSLTRVEKIGSSISDNVLRLLNKFKYKSIHLPVLKDGEFIKYPDVSVDRYLALIDNIIVAIKPNTILIHPDQVEDFKWVANKYGKLLAFENMDSKKVFGKTIEDMRIIFQKCPDARWVFDVNHLWTNDKTMKSANIFFSEFSNRLAHYHLSGYGGFHDALCVSKEDEILKGIKSLKYPIIDEGNLLQKCLLKEEFEYINQRLKF
jgi:hypothetical protein